MFDPIYQTSRTHHRIISEVETVEQLIKPRSRNAPGVFFHLESEGWLLLLAELTYVWLVAGTFLYNRHFP